MICESCLVPAETSKCTLIRVTGLVLAWRLERMKVNYCSRCLRSEIVKFNLYNLFLGWWSLHGLLATPFALIWNSVIFFRSFGTPAPDADAKPVSMTEEEMERLKLYTTYIVEQMAAGYPARDISYAVAEKAKLEPAQVMLFIKVVAKSHPGLGEDLGL